MQTKSLKNKRIVLIAILLILLILQIWIKIPCPFYQLTGFYCPGCGMTRAVFSLFHLNLIASLHNNLFLIVVLYLLLKYFLRGKIELNQKYALPILILVIAYGVLRNLPFSIFDFLKPI